MKLLTFQASRFAWEPFSKTLEDAPEAGLGGHAEDALIAFMHVEGKDTADDGRPRAFRHTLKHLKWLANKGEHKTIVLHSFAHLGGSHAEPEAAKDFIDALDERLTRTGYTVLQTPFGYFCSWDLAVYGQSLAKVFKEI